MTVPYEVLLDVAAVALRSARDAEDAPDYQRPPLEKMLHDLEVMYEVVVANKDVEPSITCPRCNMRSYNPNDISQGYCGHCNAWTSQPRGAESHS